MGHPPMRLEISTGISGVEFEDCYASRIVDDFDGVTINIIDLLHLKTDKRQRASERSSRFGKSALIFT
jgi:hypothetical protein